jgi:4-hydroxy-3-methylbut-2-enyl diphosphate reductase IspH
MVEGAQTVGICGATSTPKWQMEALAKTIHEIFTQK